VARGRIELPTRGLSGPEVEEHIDDDPR